MTFLDDLEPHPVADMERYAEPLGDRGQFWCDDQLVGVVWRRGCPWRLTSLLIIPGRLLVKRTDARAQPGSTAECRVLIVS